MRPLQLSDTIYAGCFTIDNSSILTILNDFDFLLTTDEHEPKQLLEVAKSTSEGMFDYLHFTIHSARMPSIRCYTVLVDQLKEVYSSGAKILIHSSDSKSLATLIGITLAKAQSIQLYPEVLKVPLDDAHKKFLTHFEHHYIK